MVLFIVISVFALLLIAYGLSKAYHLGEVHRKLLRDDEIELIKDRIDQLKSERNMAEEVLSKMESRAVSEEEKASVNRLKELIRIIKNEIEKKRKISNKLS